MLPLGLVLGFVLLFLLLFRDRLLPATPINTARVLVTLAAPDTTEERKAAVSDTPLFQASGWLEPDPYPVKASALIDGIVQEVHVQDGALVQKGDLLVSLVDEDASLALAAAELQVEILLSSRETHLAAIKTASQRQEAALAETEAIRTLVEEAADQRRRFDNLRGGAASESDIIAARLRLQREQARHAAAKAKAEEHAAEVVKLQTETKAKDGEIAFAKVNVDKAGLALRRTRIAAPVQGRVLRLMASPGEKKMLAMDQPDSSTVCILYDPKKLQVRVDVPLADASKLRLGQKAKIHCGLLPDTAFEGEVTRITGEADVQRNTLQAKVRVLNPDDRLRPEMLCRVEFLGETSTGEEDQTGQSSLALWIPQDAAQGDAVWTYDPESGRVARRTVQVLDEKRDHYTRVTGLNPGEHVVISPGDLRDGQRVSPTLTNP